MKKSIEKKYSHLTYKDRSVIHEFLNYGYSFTAIGNRIHKDRTTVAKEIKAHRFIRPYKKTNDIDCPTLFKPPYVCNGCKLIGECRKAKLLYDAAIADHEYRQTLSLQRANLKVTKDQVAAINDVIAPLMVHKHHSVNHVFASHPELLPFNKSTFYRYVDMGLLDVKNIDLQRKVRFKVKKEYGYSRDKIDHQFRLGRQYHDFQDYMELHSMASIVEMDIATPALVASILNAKYVNNLPLERQSKPFKERGITLNSNTLANWVINSSETYLSLLFNRMHACIYDSKVMHVDETPCDVMRIDSTKNDKKTYMWVYRNRSLCGTPPIVLYDWQKSREPDHPRDFLKNFSGTIICVYTSL